MILGIDPGRDKTGWALVEEGGGLVAAGIFGTSDAEAFVRAVAANSLQALRSYTRETGDGVRDDPFVIHQCLVGDGTGSRPMVDLMKAVCPHVLSVREKGTTLRARELYWRLYPPRGVQRLIPKGLRTPPRGEMDDFAAWAIVLEFLERREQPR